VSSSINPEKQAGVEKQGWPKKRLLPLLILLLTIGVTVGLFLFARRYPEKIEEFKTYGYLGDFIVCLISNATVILPVPGILIFIPLAHTLNPVLVGLVGATGGVIGEVTGYMAGYGGQGVARRGRMYDRVENWMKKWGVWVVFIFAAAPFLPVDVAGMVAGALRFPLWKYMVAVWVGKSIKYVVLMLLAAWGWQAVLHFFG
jgi:membrane protein YqaA with SNARE-associated domain